MRFMQTESVLQTKNRSGPGKKSVFCSPGPYVCMYVVCMSTFSNIFSSETTRPIEVKFHTEPPCDGGTKVCSNGPGHITKMAAMPIYGKKP